MELTETVEIAAPAGEVWAVLADVERWPEWTESISRVEPVDPMPLVRGSKVRIEQPKLAPATWTVTKLEAERGFEWETSTRGVRTLAGHWLEVAGGGTRVTLSLRQGGFPLLFLGWYVRRIGQRYLAMEAAGLKRRCEAAGLSER